MVGPVCEQGLAGLLDRLRFAGRGRYRHVSSHEIPQVRAGFRHVIPHLVRHEIPHGDDGASSSGGLARGSRSPPVRQAARTGAVMGRRTFDVVDLVELFTHWEAGRSQSQIADILNLDRKTIRKYTALLAELGLEPGGPPGGRAGVVGRIAQWFPVSHMNRIGSILPSSSAESSLRD